jgi:predicted nucleic acid-binding protein
MTKKIFIDSSYIIGLFVQNDNWHENAKRIIDELDNKERIICTSVLNESITLINKKLGVEASKKAYTEIFNNFIIIQENIPLYNAAMKILIQYHKLSLTDSIIIEIMKKHKITEIVSFDKDFDKIKGIKRIH